MYKYNRAVRRLYGHVRYTGTECKTTHELTNVIPQKHKRKRKGPVGGDRINLIIEYNLVKPNK